MSEQQQEPVIDEKAVIAKFNDLNKESKALLQKVTELEVDFNEHQYVFIHIFILIGIGIDRSWC